tara:strand:- start:98 stop:532 length:435 start_codon:yes stop_codon:yes gene_type:complete
MTTSNIKLPTSFWVVSIIALLWNLMGLFQFLAQVYMTDEVREMLPEDQQELYTNVPVWATAAFGIAVIAGTLGCLGLLMKRKWAKTLFVISLIGILIQATYNIFISGAMDVLGAQALMMPIFIIIIAAFLIWYSQQAIAKGWLV